MKKLYYVRIEKTLNFKTKKELENYLNSERTNEEVIKKIEVITEKNFFLKDITKKYECPNCKFEYCCEECKD